jgi:hypothetical protein
MTHEWRSLLWFHIKSLQETELASIRTLHMRDRRNAQTCSRCREIGCFGQSGSWQNHDPYGSHSRPVLNRQPMEEMEDGELQEDVGLERKPHKEDSQTCSLPLFCFVQ